MSSWSQYGYIFFQSLKDYLTKLSTKINSYYYNGDNGLKLKGEETLEKIIKILEENGADTLLNILKNN